MRLKLATVVLASLAAGLLSAGPLHAAEPSVTGFWEQSDDRGHGWFLFYERDGMYQAAIAKMFLKPQEPRNPICAGCAGDQKNAPVFGLVFIKGMQRNGLAYEKGTITDPRSGSVYQAKMKLSPDGQKLTVRGFLGFDLFGQDQIWSRLPDNAVPVAELPPNLVPIYEAMEKQQALDKKPSNGSFNMMPPNGATPPRTGISKNLTPNH